MLEGRDAIQRDHDRLERWAHVNLTKFSKAKYKILYLSWGNPQCQYRLSDELNERCTAEDLEIVVDEKLDVGQQSWLAAWKVSCILGCIK